MKTQVKVQLQPETHNRIGLTITVGNFNLRGYRVGWAPASIGKRDGSAPTRTAPTGWVRAGSVGAGWERGNRWQPLALLHRVDRANHQTASGQPRWTVWLKRRVAAQPAKSVSTALVTGTTQTTPSALVQRYGRTALPTWGQPKKQIQRKSHVVWTAVLHLLRLITNPGIVGSASENRTCKADSKTRKTTTQLWSKRNMVRLPRTKLDYPSDTNSPARNVPTNTIHGRSDETTGDGNHMGLDHNHEFHRLSAERQETIFRIRRQIMEGTYDTDKKFELALERLLGSEGLLDQDDASTVPTNRSTHTNKEHGSQRTGLIRLSENEAAEGELEDHDGLDWQDGAGTV